MKEVTLKIPDSKYGFFMKLVKELGFEISENIEIPEEHKQIVRNRIKTEKTGELISWEEAREKFIFK